MAGLHLDPSTKNMWNSKLVVSMQATTIYEETGPVKTKKKHDRKGPIRNNDVKVAILDHLCLRIWRFKK